MQESALQPAALEGDRARLAALELDVAQRDRELTTLKQELHALQSRYLEVIGGLYARLHPIETEIAEIEIAAGLRPAPDRLDEEDDDAERGAKVDAAGNCSHRTAPSADLKRIFRQLARTIHPDLARDGAARYRRHSLMAEANRAYAERDEDRLRLILSTWERNPESFATDDGDAARVERRLAVLEERRLAMAAEMAELQTSAIFRLNVRIGEARRQGWDLFGEMVKEVERDIRRATARLASLRKPGFSRTSR